MHESEERVVVEQLCVAATHPSLPGHFPGAPIVPGVVLLSMVVEQVRHHFGPSVVRRLRNVKFQRPLSPDARFDVELEARPPGGVRFVCRGADGILAEGALEVESAPTRT